MTPSKDPDIPIRNTRASFSSTSTQRDWLRTLRRYVAFVAGANLVWEFAHLPLYTIWWEKNAGQNIFAALHCTGGDVLIAVVCLLSALILRGTAQWPHKRFIEVATVTVALGLGYTIFSEWLNIEVRQSWAYSEFMPVIPLIGTGLSPIAQWIVIPVAAFWLAYRSNESKLLDRDPPGETQPYRN